MRRAWVPLPAPTGPSRTTSSARESAPNEAPVVTHDELRLELAHGVERDADHDQHRRALNGQGLEAGKSLHDKRQDGHDAQEERPGDGDADEYRRQILVGWPT